jgi:hypothetical protein
MNLFKRHIGRRVAGVGIGVALLMLGLEAPAFAAAPTISSFTPTNGPALGGCVVVVTGTGFDDFPAAANYTVNFVLSVAPNTVVPATDYLVISDTELWTTAPTLAAGSDYNIKITNPGGTSTSSGTFLATNSAGACAPTVTAMAPSCGSAGTTVKITGTNLLMETAVPATPFEGDIDGGLVSFSPYTSDATHTIPDVDESTSLSVVVPSGSADGPIKVTTKGTTAAPQDGMSVFSTARFEVPPPDCVPVGPVTHARSISLSLRKHLVARGKVSVGDAFTDCAASVPVKIQRRVSGHWKTVGSTTTSDTGAYNKRIRNRAGKYRAKAPKVSLGTPVTDICSGATSPVRRVS